MKYLTNIDLQSNQLQNATLKDTKFEVVNSLPTASTANKGKHVWYNNTEYVCDGSKWVDALSQGDYTFQNGVELVSGTRNVQVKLGTSSNATVTATSDGLAVSVADASTSAKGVIEIADDSDISTGTATDKAVTPAQLATGLSGKVDKLSTGPTAGTYTKVTVTANGLVSAGADATLADIGPANGKVTTTETELNQLHEAGAVKADFEKLHAITADATELNYVDGVTSSIQNQLNDKLELGSLSVASGSTNYMTYDNTSGEFALNVDSTPTASSNNLVTSGGVKSYVDGKISTTYKAAGSKAFAQLPSLSSSIEGNVYNVSDAFTTTADFVEGAGNNYPAGTNVVCINTAASGQTAVYKWDVLAGFVDVSDFITAISPDTLKNKGIDATDNTISNLETSHFKSGVVVTSIAATGTSDSKLPTEKAVRDGLNDKQNLVTSATANDIAFLNASGQVIDSGKSITSSVEAASTASSDKIPTEAAVRTAINTAAGAAAHKKYKPLEDAYVTFASGQVTWTFSNEFNDADVMVQIRDSAGELIIADVEISSSTITISFNAESKPLDNAYRAVIIG